jgi:hypothetical protein
MQGPIQITVYSTGDYAAFDQPASVVVQDGERCLVCGRTVGPRSEGAIGFQVLTPHGAGVVCLEDADVRESAEEFHA